MPALKHLGYLKNAFDPRLAETLEELSQALDNVAQKAGVAGNSTAAPPQIRSLAVSAANGFFSVAIVDPLGEAQPSLGIHYFLEYDISSAFSNRQVVDNGPSRNAYLALGSQTLFFRVYSQYRNSPRSPYVIYGGNQPIGVVGGGSAGPALPTSQGSGGAGGRFGFGGK
jgi:hypothetical protein